jgi:hypothetical protein
LIWVYAVSNQPERYLSAGRRLSAANGLGEIVADFDVQRGVLINGRVLESGTGRPIGSNPPVRFAGASST